MKNKFVMFLLIVMLVSCTLNDKNKEGELQIHDLQGCSHLSPFEGKEVDNIKGIVTHKISNGFTMQGLIYDDESCSSEAIFVFTKDFPTVMKGDLVSVDGMVAEFTSGGDEDFNLAKTELLNPTITIEKSNQSLPDPIVLDEMADFVPDKEIENDRMTSFDISDDGLDFFESLEFMLVEIKDGVVIAPKNRYNEIVVLPESYLEMNTISLYKTLLEHSTDQNPEKVMVKLPSGSDDEINAGDLINTPIIGIMDYSYGNYKVLSLNQLEFIETERIVKSFIPLANGLTIASYNVENLSLFDEESKFSRIARQVVKFMSSPDILVLHEIMDDSGTADDGETSSQKTIEKLISAIKKQGGPKYLFSDAPPENNQDGGVEGGNIRSVLLYRTDRGISLEPAVPTTTGIGFFERFQVQENPFRIGLYSESFSNSRNPAFWLLNLNGKQFFISGVHLVSQSTNSPDWGSQQPPQRSADEIRIDQAENIQKIVMEILDMKSDVPILITGDMNAAPWSETMETLLGVNLYNTSEMIEKSERFSYIFEGNAMQLDYILISKNLMDEVRQTRFLNLNSIMDQSKQISDHDPVIAEINLP